MTSSSRREAYSMWRSCRFRSRVWLQSSAGPACATATAPSDAVKTATTIRAIGNSDRIVVIHPSTLTWVRSL